MDCKEEAIRKNIAQNIAFYRKQKGDTQAELAQKLNYSDKSISKWERSEGMPDVLVLAKLAALYDIRVDDLLQAGPVSPKRRRTVNRSLITLMGLGLVWLVAALVFFVLGTTGIQRAWLCFICALPASGVVLVVFSALWFSLLWQGVSVSLIIWGMAVSLHLGLACFADFRLIYAIAAVLQILNILWHVYRKTNCAQRQKSGEA